MLKCPSCGRQVKVLWGTFPCPWCGEKLRWYLGLSLLECSLLGVGLLFVLFLIAFWVWPVEYAPWLGGVLVLLVAFPLGLFFFIRLWKWLRGIAPHV
jgi:hypothetical protein